MRIKLILSTMSLFMFLTVNMAFAQKKNEEVTKFKVSLHCENCVNKVKANIPYEKGVRDLKVSLEKKEVEVTYRADRTSPGALIKAFEKLDFKAEVIKDEDKGNKENKIEKQEE